MHHLEDHHLELGLQESTQAEPGAFARWVKNAECNLEHSLDGSEQSDGYSLDSAFAAYKAGVPSAHYAATIRSAMSDIDS